MTVIDGLTKRARNMAREENVYALGLQALQTACGRLPARKVGELLVTYEYVGKQTGVPTLVIYYRHCKVFEQVGSDIRVARMGDVSWLSVLRQAAHEAEISARFSA